MAATRLVGDIPGTNVIVSHNPAPAEARLREASVEKGTWLNIAACVDTRGFSSLWTMLHSLLASRAESTCIRLLIVHDGLSARKLDSIKRLSDQAGNTLTTFQSIEPSDYFRGRPPFGLMTYARIMIPSCVPWNRVLYIDTDVIVRADVSHLMGRAMRHTLAAVAQGTVGHSNCKTVLMTRGIEASTPYLNAGVMLIDCESWNAEGLTKALLEMGEAEEWRFPTADQTLLNLYVRGAFDQLPTSYNELAWAAAKPLSAKASAGIMTHFLGRPKPWEIGGRVNRQYDAYCRLVAEMNIGPVPFELADVGAVMHRIVRYIPSYYRCAKSRLSNR